MRAKKSIGVQVQSPEETCNDKRCPFHGNLKTHGKTFKGVVSSDKMAKAVSVEFQRWVYVPKYERYMRRLSRIKAHVPECMTITQGETVRIMETRPLSKTINFVVIEKIEG